ncbi:hypothetical protein ASF80_07930 [Microbacterium sp. Leaf159]|nr:hypothetical protein ASF80_07930 [Microbacterium sp. Leaf159]
MGLGTMGSGIVRLLARSGIIVRGYDPQPVAGDRLTDEGLASFTTTTSIEDCVHGADIVFEAVHETLEAKAPVLRSISAATNGVIASNTSTLMPSTMTGFVDRPERFLVAHFFNPPEIVPLVEVIPAPETSEEVKEQIMEILRHLGSTPVLLDREYPGFVANRLQAAILREALHLVEEGIVSPENLDEVVRTGLGPRWSVAGPIGVADLGGLDIFERVCAELFPRLSNASQPPEALTERVAEGDLGAKSGRGFYRHTKEADGEHFDQMAALFAQLRKGN